MAYKYKQVISACVVSGLLAGLSSAQTQYPYANCIGATYSNLSGYGAFYQRSFMKNYAVRATAFVKYYEYLRGPEEKPLVLEKNSYYNFGLDIQRNIISDSRYRVFAIAAAGYMAGQNKPRSEDDKVGKTTVAEGLGLGAELYALKRFSGNLSFLYSFDNSREKHTEDPDLNNSITRKTKLGVSAGLGVSF